MKDAYKELVLFFGSVGLFLLAKSYNNYLDSIEEEERKEHNEKAQEKTNKTDLFSAVLNADKKKAQKQD